MKKAKKLGLQSLALVLMAFVLVAGVAFGMTGAWFTDGHKAKSANLTFGNVEVTKSGTGIHAYRAADVTTKTEGQVALATNAANTDEQVMPGDYIVIDFSITKVAGSADFYYMVFLTVEAAETNGTSLEGDAATALNADSTTATLVNVATAQNLSQAIELPGNVFGDSYETKVFTVTWEVRLIQAANLNAAQAKSALETAANYAYTESSGVYTFTENGVFTITQGA